MYQSHPHGCVSWNAPHCAWVSQTCQVTPSRVCELKWITSAVQIWCGVTPSRVCELKSNTAMQWVTLNPSHTLTGVWVEISGRLSVSSAKYRHTLTGVWVEISDVPVQVLFKKVTPSRVCELKSSGTLPVQWFSKSHPHGCVSWNIKIFHSDISYMSHPHGCVSWNLSIPAWE